MERRLTPQKLMYWLAFSVVLWLLAMAAGLWALQWLQTPMTLSDNQREFIVTKGQSTAEISQALAQHHKLAHPSLWRLYLQVNGNKQLKAGEYRFAEQLSPLEMAQQLQRGEVIVRTITFAEGLRLKDWLVLLAQHPKLKHELANASDAELKKKLDFGYDHLEGWFFPDTYAYQAGDSDLDILRRAHKKMQSTLERLWRQRQEGLPYASPLEALTMASIVEKETGLASERPDIAGVFVRRLRKNMRLQTDPTVIYGLGDAYSGNLTSQHLQTPTAYNTYTQAGLPPSPIANPGEAALAAALNPAAGDALYFVAKGDGSHEFSSSLQQHNQAVERFQRSGRRQDYRASPAAQKAP